MMETLLCWTHLLCSISGRLQRPLASSSALIIMLLLNQLCFQYISEMLEKLEKTTSPCWWLVQNITATNEELPRKQHPGSPVPALDFLNLLQMDHFFLSSVVLLFIYLFCLFFKLVFLFPSGSPQVRVLVAFSTASYHFTSMTSLGLETPHLHHNGHHHPSLTNNNREHCIIPVLQQLNWLSAKHHIQRTTKTKRKSHEREV